MTNKKNGISLNISDDGDVSIQIPEEEESVEDGFKCLIIGKICKSCQHIPANPAWLPAEITCMAAKPPTIIFRLDNCPEHHWYKGTPPSPRVPDEKE